MSRSSILSLPEPAPQLASPAESHELNDELRQVTRTIAEKYLEQVMHIAVGSSGARASPAESPDEPTAEPEPAPMTSDSSDSDSEIWEEAYDDGEKPSHAAELSCSLCLAVMHQLSASDQDSNCTGTIASSSSRAIGIRFYGGQAVQQHLFARAHPTIKLDGPVAECGSGREAYWRAAITDLPMTSGEHYLEFEPSAPILLGVIKAACFDVTSDADPVDDASNLLFNPYEKVNTAYGMLHPHGFSTSESREHSPEDRIGLLLDVDAGTLLVFMNDNLIGRCAGLNAGAYTWAVILRQRQSVRIEAKPVPRAHMPREI